MKKNCVKIREPTEERRQIEEMFLSCPSGGWEAGYGSGKQEHLWIVMKGHIISHTFTINFCWRKIKKTNKESTASQKRTPNEFSVIRVQVKKTGYSETFTVSLRGGLRKVCAWMCLPDVEIIYIYYCPHLPPISILIGLKITQFCRVFFFF